MWAVYGGPSTRAWGGVKDANPDPRFDQLSIEATDPARPRLRRMIRSTARSTWPRWNRPTWRIVVLVMATLIAIDLVFVTMHVLRILLLKPGVEGSRLLEDPRLSLGADRGYGELYGYAKLMFSVVVLVVMGIRVPGPAYVAWAIALLVVFVDDSWLVHERLGHELAQWLELAPTFGLRAQDLGELLAWTIIGIPLLAILIIGHRLSAPSVRRDSGALAILLLALGFFGVAVDMVQIEATGSGWLSHLAGLVEDGGELIVISVIAAFVVGSMLTTPSRTRSIEEELAQT
jgi:hypothetical protein